MSLSLNGIIHYSSEEVNDVIEIPLHDEKLPHAFSVLVTDDNYELDEESQLILIDYLNGNRCDATTLSINVFAPDGRLLHIANKILEENR